jgi:16S rRNA (cytidine1402-2'-O)-methyltransferase
MDAADAMKEPGTMGTLYLVATPIGNLEDITLRALRILREVPLIAAEDTRHTRKLLNHFEIATPAISYHQHSGPARAEAVLAALGVGDVALVTDAGTPAISDPGAELVRAAIAAGYPVVPIPGPVAAIAALIASGLPTDRFTFAGFLPRKSAERRAALERLCPAAETLIFYEAPHRLLATLADLCAVLGDRPAALAREMTKLHEEWRRGPLSTLRAEAASGTAPRGEYCIVVAGAELAGEATKTGAEEAMDRETEARERLRGLLAGGMRTREAAAQAAAATGLPRREAYRLALEVAGDSRQ